MAKSKTPSFILTIQKTITQTVPSKRVKRHGRERALSAFIGIIQIDTRKHNANSPNSNVNLLHIAKPYMVILPTAS